MSGWRGLYGNGTCQLWYDTVQLQRCRWVTCKPGVCRHPAAIWSLWSLRHDGFLSQDSSIRTPNKRSRLRDRTAKESWARQVPLTGTQQTSSAREEETGLSTAAPAGTEPEGDGQTRTFERSASLPKSVSIMGCLLSHPLNSALFTRAVSQKSVSHF